MANYDYQYELRFGETIPDEVRDRSYKWRRLREGLGNLLSGDTDTMTIVIPEEDPKQAEDRVRQAVYNWSNSPGIELRKRDLIARSVATLRKSSNGNFERLVYVWLEHKDGTMRAASTHRQATANMSSR